MVSTSHKPRRQGVFQLRSVSKRIGSLLRTPLFWLLSVAGNLFILAGAGLFHWLEAGRNGAILGFLDSLGWAVGIVTTVGSSNIHPVTPGGKVLAIFMMMAGAVFLWSYMAFFVGALVEPELRQIEREVSEIQHEVADLQDSGLPGKGKEHESRGI